MIFAMVKEALQESSPRSPHDRVKSFLGNHSWPCLLTFSFLPYSFLLPGLCFLSGQILLAHSLALMSFPLPPNQFPYYFLSQHSIVIFLRSRCCNLKFCVDVFTFCLPQYPLSSVGATFVFFHHCDPST